MAETWYGRDMSQDPISRRGDRALRLVAFITLGTVGFVQVRNLYQTGARWDVAAVLVLAFGVLQACIPQEEAPDWQAHLFLAISAGLVGGLLASAPEATLYPILFCILSPQAMLLFPHRLGMAWIGVFLLIIGGNQLRVAGLPEGLFGLAVYAAANSFFGIFAYALNRADEARRESQRLLVELQAAHRQLAAFADRVEELAVVDERNRLAREMHDTLGHRLTVAAVQLEGAQRLIPHNPERAAGMVGVVREQVSEALSELRRTVTTLRAPLEEDLQLRRALQRLVNHFEEATSITVHLMLPDERPDLSDPYRVALYRAAQEALTNVQRHAQAGEVWVQLIQQDGRITLLVGDNGVGPTAKTPSNSEFGLRGLRERAARLGGEMHVDPRPGGGTQLRFSLPLPQERTHG